MTIAIDKMEVCGLSNTPHQECILKKTKVMWYSTVATRQSFSYKGEWANQGRSQDFLKEVSWH